MTITIRAIGRRLRSMKQLSHMPTVFGQGKWETKRSLWKYKRLSRRRRLIAAASRRRNRRTR